MLQSTLQTKNYVETLILLEGSFLHNNLLLFLGWRGSPLVVVCIPEYRFLTTALTLQNRPFSTIYWQFYAPKTIK